MGMKNESNFVGKFNYLQICLKFSWPFKFAWFKILSGKLQSLLLSKKNLWKSTMKSVEQLTHPCYFELLTLYFIFFEIFGHFSEFLLRHRSPFSFCVIWSFRFPIYKCSLTVCERIVWGRVKRTIEGDRGPTTVGRVSSVFYPIIWEPLWYLYTHYVEYIAENLTWKVYSKAF